jgi:hypothetical protein
MGHLAEGGFFGCLLRLFFGLSSTFESSTITPIGAHSTITPIGAHSTITPIG